MSRSNTSIGTPTPTSHHDHQHDEDVTRRERAIATAHAHVELHPHARALSRQPSPALASRRLISVICPRGIPPLEHAGAEEREPFPADRLSGGRSADLRVSSALPGDGPDAPGASASLSEFAQPISSPPDLCAVADLAAEPSDLDCPVHASLRVDHAPGTRRSFVGREDRVPLGNHEFYYRTNILMNARRVCCVYEGSHRLADGR